MAHLFSFFLVCLLIILEAEPAHANEDRQPVSRESAIIAETGNFQIFCFENKECAATNVTSAERRAAQRGLDELQSARDWLKKMGFNVDNANMDSGTDDKKALRLQYAREIHEARCDGLSVACHILSVNDKGRIILPVESIDSLANGETLIHEYIHAIQPARDGDNAQWLNEMVATAIGSAWVRKRTGNAELYQPKFSMVLDREFWDGKDDPGYGKWDYAIALGEKIGSQDGVAYLAQGMFINASNNPESRLGNSMVLFYDAALVEAATFETFFPEYVARFNNVEDGGDQLDRTGKYFYYGDIAKHELEMPAPGQASEAEFPGNATAFAAHPMLLSLKFPSLAEEPADNILLAEVEITQMADPVSLTLVREHRLTTEKHRDFFVIDANDAPTELGFYRVVHTPAPDTTADAPFALSVRTRPITFDPPTCLQAGKPSEMTVSGLENSSADNWRLKVDNGSVDGLIITPHAVGAINIEIEIDGIITRAEAGLEPKTPKKTLVDLGTYDVADDECMVRMTMNPGNLVMTYVGNGNYSEIEPDSDGRSAIYVTASDIRVWEEEQKWISIPSSFKAMIFASLAKENPAMRMEFPGMHYTDADFFWQMPQRLSQRLKWSNARKIPGPDGKEPTRTNTACPDVGSGCTKAIIWMEGTDMPIIFDAQGRPKVITMKGITLNLEYGIWNVRRPPGW